MALFDRFKRKEPTPAEQQALDAGLEKTRTGFFDRISKAVAGKDTVDEEVLDDLEHVLVASDVGVKTTVEIIRRIEARVARDKYVEHGRPQRARPRRDRGSAAGV